MDDRQKKILDRLENQCARRECCSSDVLRKATEPYKIRLALAAKRIPKEIVDAALEEIDGNRAGQKLRRLLEAKWKTLEGDEAAKYKLLRYALSRGYEYEQIRGIVDEIAG